MSAIVSALATSLGPDRTEHEILDEILSSQCCHRFKERRIQAALLCRTLSSQCRLDTIVERILPELIRMAHHETEIAVEVRVIFERLITHNFIIHKVLTLLIDSHRSRNIQTTYFPVSNSICNHINSEHRYARKHWNHLGLC